MDLEKSEEGRWVKDPWGAGIETLIARAGNKKAREMTVKLSQERLREIKAKRPGVVEEIAKTVAAHCVCKNWRGMDGDDGEPLPYSSETALEIFNDPRYAHYWEHVQGESGLDDEYIAESMEGAAGNS